MRISDWSSDVCSSDLEQLQQPVARRTLVPCAVAPDDLEQRIGRGVAVATRHMSGGKGKTLFMVVRAGGDFGQQCVEIVDGCCVLCQRDPRFRLGDRRAIGRAPCRGSVWPYV